MMTTPTPRSLKPTDELALPLHKRVITQYATNEDGAKELRLFYDDKEISFDEPDLFAFGEMLGKQAQFLAGDTLQWGTDYEWPRIRDLLEQLIDEEVLHYADTLDAESQMTADVSDREAPLPAGPATSPRTWLECDSLMSELTGKPLELGYLELVVPIFRVVHMALDADGRQVGESNVFPKSLRMDIPTRWRTCIYAGSRHQTERPMNVTALKSMRSHWGEIMALLLEIRSVYLRRFPDAAQGWTVGHIERLATVVLGLPTYLLMCKNAPVKNGELHPALSSLFRVTDGLRMVMHQMMFVPIGEPALPPETPMTSAEIFAYAERNYSFHSEHGVCAGPQAMIEEFLSVLVDGVTHKTDTSVALGDELQTALNYLEPATDYALLGLKAHAAIFSVWPAMARTYTELFNIADAWAADHSSAALLLRTRLHAHIEKIKHSSYLATETWRTQREYAYADMYQQCDRGVRGLTVGESLQTRWKSEQKPFDENVRQIVRAAIRQLLGDASAIERYAEKLLLSIVSFLQTAQISMRIGLDVQRDINALLQRAQPRQTFEAHDIDLHNQLQGQSERRVPYLVDELEEILGLRIYVDRHRVKVAIRDTTCAYA